MPNAQRTPGGGEDVREKKRDGGNGSGRSGTRVGATRKDRTQAQRLESNFNKAKDDFTRDMRTALGMNEQSTGKQGGNRVHLEAGAETFNRPKDGIGKDASSAGSAEMTVAKQGGNMRKKAKMDGAHNMGSRLGGTGDTGQGL